MDLGTDTWEGVRPTASRPPADPESLAPAQAPWPAPRPPGWAPSAGKGQGCLRDQGLGRAQEAALVLEARRLTRDGAGLAPGDTGAGVLTPASQASPAQLRARRHHHQHLSVRQADDK